MKYGKKQARHRYVVRATRRVRRPEYGPEAYTLSTTEAVFPYGKGQKFADGHDAKLAALAHAACICREASEVSVWKCNGYGGEGTYIKQSKETFRDGWSSEEA